jgi:hypothetical protein
MKFIDKICCHKDFFYFPVTITLMELFPLRGQSKRKRNPNKSRTFAVGSNIVYKIWRPKNLFQFLVSIIALHYLTILLVPYAAVK